VSACTTPDVDNAPAIHTHASMALTGRSIVIPPTT
jgi:hypothetical protein